MPGPGGGSHGGGGFSGGSHGGGFHGGGFHGGGMPLRRHFRPPYHGGWHRPPRHYGSGCSFGFIAIIAIIIISITAMSSLGIVFINRVFPFANQPNYSYEEVIEGTQYDENVFQDYANTQYKNEFGQADAYEDNILLVFLTEDNTYSDYYYIAWIGDHIDTDINYMFGNEETVFGRTILNTINTSSYKYSLDSNIADIVTEMSNEISNLGLDTSFKCEENHNKITSHLTNNTSIEFTEDTVNTALEEFTKTTGIPIVIVVDDMDNVFPVNQIQTTQPIRNTTISILPIIEIVFIIVLIIVIFVVLIKRKKKIDAELENDN